MTGAPPSSHETGDANGLQARESLTPSGFSEVPEDWTSGIFISERGPNIAIAVVTIMPGDELNNVIDYLRLCDAKIRSRQPSEDGAT